MVNASSVLAPIVAAELGANLAITFNMNTPGYTTAVAAMNPKQLRWPGGSIADGYHWQTHQSCNGANNLQTAYNPASTFDNFMSTIVMPASYNVSITVDYGSDPTCTTGGLPSEAAGWVAHAKASGYNSRTNFWTIGNEEFGSWEQDLHANAHDPTTYANAVAGSNGFYASMKAADSTAKVGVLVEGANPWDSIVMANAPFDFVEFHWYAQQPGSESDQYLLYQAPGVLTQTINTIKSELAAAGKGSTPIMLGEFNSVAYNPGKQTVSVVNGLFTGMAFGEILNDGLAAATWWFGAGGSPNCGNNNSSSLYGWQNFGGYDLVALGGVWDPPCGGTNIPQDAVFPSGEAFLLVSQFAVPGNSMLSASVISSLSDVRAYAATQGTGYAVMLFNLNETTTSTVTVGVTNAAGSQYTATTSTYGKAQYDESQQNVWAGPVTASLGSVGTTVSVSLPPLSMTVLKLQ